MVDLNNKDSQKTIVAFVVGLLIGGIIVSAFSGNDKATEKMAEKETEEVMSEEKAMEESMEEKDEVTSAPTLTVGEGNIVINNQAASRLIAIESATYPVSEGWIGVRGYENEDLGRILGVVRFSESQGLVPENIILQTDTIAGRNYAVVIFTEDGDFDFNLAGDVQIDTIFDTFTAE
jgi:hypothetical protein